jgi:citrate lyase subunit beta/citryl-CoA lyase
MTEPESPRPGPAILFVPADRPDRYHKALDRSDTVVIDLEDATAPADKDAARQTVLDNPLDPERTVIRLNGVTTPWFDNDLAALRTTAYTRVMLPKAETRADIERLEPFEVIAVCETPLGVYNAGEIASASNTVALIAGVEDLVGAIGGTSTQFPDTQYRDIARYARASILVAARAFGKWAIDTVYLDIADIDGQRREAADAAASGFVASACIHPSQVGVIRDAYTPTAEDVAWATAVLEASVGNHGVFEYRGRMVDSPVLNHARSVLARRDRTAPSSQGA